MFVPPLDSMERLPEEGNKKDWTKRNNSMSLDGEINEQLLSTDFIAGYDER
jgi:hypothetical protein